ncbi:MAG: hypothetical protein ACXAE3_16480 [Candidatus Kariarchaeaceae archaeon]|jgi:hypothetical protein
MVSFSDYDDMGSAHLRRLSKLNLIYFIFPFLSAIYDYIYLTLEIVIGGFIMNILVFVLIYQLKNYNPRIRWAAIIWLVLVVAASLYVIFENLTTSVEGIAAGQQIAVGIVWSVLALYFIYGLYTLLLDSETKALFTN